MLSSRQQERRALKMRPGGTPDPRVCRLISPLSPGSQAPGETLILISNLNSEPPHLGMPDIYARPGGALPGATVRDLPSPRPLRRHSDWPQHRLASWLEIG